MNSKVQVKFKKKHKDAILPTKNNKKDSGYDIYSVCNILIPAKSSAIVETGIDLADITEGYWFRIQGRSGLGFKHGLAPHFGIIDNQYRGNLGVKVYNLSNHDYHVSKGDRIAQFIIYKLYDSQVSWADQKTITNRGEDGFGSSGK